MSMSVKCHKETSCAALPGHVAKFKQAMQFLYRIVSHNGCDMIRIRLAGMVVTKQPTWT